MFVSNLNIKVYKLTWLRWWMFVFSCSICTFTCFHFCKSNLKTTPLLLLIGLILPLKDRCVFGAQFLTWIIILLIILWFHKHLPTSFTSLFLFVIIYRTHPKNVSRLVNLVLIVTVYNKHVYMSISKKHFI